MLFGLSLLFAGHDSTDLYAIVKSYVRWATTAQEAQRVARELGSAKENSTMEEFVGLEYVGIYDVFLVSDRVRDGAMLGRTTEDEWTSAQTIAENLEPPGAYAATGHDCSRGRFLVGLAYLVTPPAMTAYGLHVLTATRATSPIEAVQRATELAQHSELRSAVIAHGQPHERIADLHFVGIKDVAAIVEDAAHEGAFQRLVRMAASRDEIEDELLHDDDLGSFFAANRAADTNQ